MLLPGKHMAVYAFALLLGDFTKGISAIGNLCFALRIGQVGCGAQTGVVVVVAALPDFGTGRAGGDLFELVAAVVAEQRALAAAAGGVGFVGGVAVGVVLVGDAAAQGGDRGAIAVVVVAVTNNPPALVLLVQAVERVVGV